MKEQRRVIRKDRLAVLLLLISLVVGGAVWFTVSGSSDSTPVSAGGQEPDESATDPFAWPELPDRAHENDIVLPVGMLLTTKARAAYESGSLRLVVPRLGLDCPVGDDTLMENLEHGPGLYKYSQIPDIYNTNVCIAAHRDLAGCEFYDLDKLTDGDCIYLVYNGMVFRYEYRSTAIVESHDWDPIRTHADCRVTLTTCDPIGTEDVNNS